MKKYIDFTVAAVSVLAVVASAAIWEKNPELNNSINRILEKLESKHDFTIFWNAINH